MPENALTMGLIIFPVSLVLGSIWPFLNTVSMPNVSFPLALIQCAIFKSKFLAFLTLAVIFWFTFFALLIPIILFLIIVYILSPKILGSCHSVACLIVHHLKLLLTHTICIVRLTWHLAV